MVVGVLTTSYPRHAGDFAGCFVADDVRRRARAGAVVEVIAAGGSGHLGTITSREGDVTVTRIGTGAWPSERSLFYGDGAPETLERGGLATWAQAAFFWAALCREVAARARRWDAIVSHWLVPCGMAAIAVAPAIRHRAYAHSGDVALLERLPGGAALARFIAASATELAFVSDDLRRRFAALAGHNVGVGVVEPLRPDPGVFMPVAREEREAIRRRLGLARPTAIAVGRLIPIKGFDLLVEACAASRVGGGEATREIDRVVDLVIDLVILGDGPERPSLERRARRLGVSLRLPGVVPRAEVAAWLAAADVYAQPSRPAPSGRTEGLPMAALEALAMGLPIVAARTGGLAELGVRGPEVSLFAAEDVRSLRGALLSSLRLHAAAPFPISS